MSERVYTYDEDNDISLNGNVLRQRLLMCAGGFALAASLAFVPGHAEELEMAAESGVSTTIAHDEAYAQGQQCPVITPEDREEVKRMFATPDSAALMQMNDRLSAAASDAALISKPVLKANGRFDFTKEDYGTEIKINDDMHAMAAKAHGLHTVALQPYIEPLLSDHHEEMAAKPFSEYLSAAQNLGAEFGINIAVSTTRPSKEKYQIPTEELLDRYTAKKNILTMMSVLTSLPVEYVQFAGTQNIWLASAEEKSGKIAYTTMDEIPGNSNIYLNMRVPISEDAYRHEIAHDFNEASCGGLEEVMKNTGFEALNHGIAYTPANKTTKDYTLDGYQDQMHVVENQLLDDTDTSSLSVADQEKRELFDKIESHYASKVNFITPYARTGLQDDFAESARSIGSVNGFEDYADERKTRLNDKFYYVMSMIKRRSAAIAGYFADTMSHYQ